jgi:hypothetical protein
MMELRELGMLLLWVRLTTKNATVMSLNLRLSSLNASLLRELRLGEKSAAELDRSELAGAARPVQAQARLFRLPP